MAMSNYRLFCREILDDGGHADHRLCAACMLGMVNAVSRYDGSIVVQELESSCGDVVPLRIVVSR